MKHHYLALFGCSLEARGLFGGCLIVKTGKKLAWCTQNEGLIIDMGCLQTNLSFLLVIMCVYSSNNFLMFCLHCVLLYNVHVQAIGKVMSSDEISHVRRVTQELWVPSATFLHNDMDPQPLPLQSWGSAVLHEWWFKISSLLSLSFKKSVPLSAI